MSLSAMRMTLRYRLDLPVLLVHRAQARTKQAGSAAGLAIRWFLARFPVIPLVVESIAEPRHPTYCMTPSFKESPSASTFHTPRSSSTKPQTQQTNQEKAKKIIK